MRILAAAASMSGALLAVSSTAQAAPILLDFANTGHNDTAITNGQGAPQETIIG
jgi:hypothetical protein